MLHHAPSGPSDSLIVTHLLRRHLRHLLAAVALALSACGGGSGPRPGGGSQGTITGLVVKGPIQAATVTAYPLDASMNRGAAISNAPTMPDGTFTLSIPPYNGALEVVAFGGTYPEEAVGVPVQLTHEFSIVIPGFQSGASVTVTISPISSMARAFAKAAIARGSPLADAVNAAWTHVNNHFGGLDWRTVQPTSLTPSQPTTVTMSNATKAGLILAGISQAARTMAETSGLSPGTSVTGGTLAGAGADDALDGTLDGNAGATALLQGSVPVTSHTFRRVLGQAIIKFVGTPYNKTQLVAADVLSLANALAADGDPYLFCPNQAVAPSCAGGSLELQPPAITFLTPPTFVNTTTVTLQVQATDPLASVTAVYAQTVSGTAIAGTFAEGVWTLSNTPLVEGPNLIFVWGVDAAGTGSIANASQITVTRDTIAPAPYVNTTAAAYYDERYMTLASAAVPPVYQFPGGATKVAPIVAAGVWKAATRLGWNTQPTPAVLEGANPDNIPFIQIALPVSPGWSPTAAGTFSLTVGTTVATGDLLPWKSPASTSTTEYYDIPLSSNVAPALATTTTAPITVAVAVQFTDAAGNTGGTSITLPPFHVIGPPIFGAEDTAYPTYNDARSTFAYTLAGNTYSTLWNSIATAFFDGQIRLVRYMLANPTPVPIAVSAAFVQDPGGSWRAAERWTPFDAGGVPGSQTCQIWAATPGGCSYGPVDGLYFYDYWEVLTGGSGSVGQCPQQAGPPAACGLPSSTVHWRGSTTAYTCLPATYWTSGVADTWATFSSATVALGLFEGPLQQGGEVVHLSSASAGMAIIPAASGNTPGTAVLYVTRSVSAPRTRSITWNGITAANRYEAAVADFWMYETSHGYPIYRVAYCDYDDYRAHLGAAWLTSARDEVYGTLSLTTAGLVGTTVIGEIQPQFATTLAGPIGSH